MQQLKANHEYKRDIVNIMQMLEHSKNEKLIKTIRYLSLRLASSLLLTLNMTLQVGTVKARRSIPRAAAATEPKQEKHTCYHTRDEAGKIVSATK